MIISRQSAKKNLSEQTKFQLSEIIGIENYFYQGINERKSYIRKLNKYITVFEYIGKILIFLSATSGGVSIISFISIVSWNCKCKLYVNFFYSKRNNKDIIKNNKK